MNHLGDTNKMVSATPRMDASAHDDGAIWQTGCDLERELNAGIDRIKRLEEAGIVAIYEAVHGREDDALEIWHKAMDGK